MRKTLFSIGLITAGLSFLASPLSASEGTAELASTRSEAMRCFVTSILMENYEYQVSLSCRDLIYPPKPDAFSYILWVTPIENNEPVNIGELGIGKGNFETKTAFSKLFVTVESDRRTKAPQGEILMEGNIQGISFLDKQEEIKKQEEQAVVPGATACLRCALPEIPSGVPTNATHGVLGAVPGILGSLEAFEVIRWLAGLWRAQPDGSGLLHHVDGETMRLKTIRIPQRRDCRCTAS